MFNINIYSNYKVTKEVNSSYKSYDSDSDDWFKNDTFDMEMVLTGAELIENISKLLLDKDFSDFNITISSSISMELLINHFDPTDGTGAEYKYSIEYVADYDKEQLFI